MNKEDKFFRDNSVIDRKAEKKENIGFTVLGVLAAGLAIIIVAAFVFFTIHAIRFGNELIKENETETYPMTTVVSEINDDEVHLLDCNGNEWIFYGAEDWQEGDIASLIMSTNGTASIYDDEIVSMRYNGNASDFII